ncbi:14442_t:CDS:2, partial [Funneliformis geosporum]
KEERKIVVEPGKRAEFEKARKEMHKKLLKEKFDDKIDKSTKFDVKGLDMKYIILPDGNDNYKEDQIQEKEVINQLQSNDIKELEKKIKINGEEKEFLQKELKILKFQLQEQSRGQINQDQLQQEHINLQIEKIEKEIKDKTEEISELKKQIAEKSKLRKDLEELQAKLVVKEEELEKIRKKCEELEKKFSLYLELINKYKEKQVKAKDIIFAMKQKDVFDEKLTNEFSQVQVEEFKELVEEKLPKIKALGNVKPTLEKLIGKGGYGEVYYDVDNNLVGFRIVNGVKETIPNDAPKDIQVIDNERLNFQIASLVVQSDLKNPLNYSSEEISNKKIECSESLKVINFLEDDQNSQEQQSQIQIPPKGNN